MEDRAWTDLDEKKMVLDNAIKDLLSAIEDEMIKGLIGPRPRFFYKNRWGRQNAALKGVFAAALERNASPSVEELREVLK